VRVDEARNQGVTGYVYNLLTGLPCSGRSRRFRQRRKVLLPARRLEALGREAAMLLARAYRQAGRHNEALSIYDELLGRDPLDRRPCEGLLIAAAGTLDMTRLHEAWERVCACLGGEEPETRTLYEKLRRELRGSTLLDGKRASVAVARTAAPSSR
jgi:hypothetical protein